jgi:ferredoxin
MRVVVDGIKCQGHGRCYDLAPDVFEPDERGRVDLAVPGDLPPGLEPDARIAVRNCPEAALLFLRDGL